jgi:L-lactate dehydrogenase complex protein LldE
MRVSLFITCYTDLLFPATGKAVVQVLERLGHEVDFDPTQTCCGQMHYNTGYQRETLPLARKFVDQYRDAEVVCAPSGSCVAMIREHYPRLAAAMGDPKLAEEIARLTPRVFEFTELLVKYFGLEEVGAYYPRRVTYHPSCHSLRLLRVGDAPVKLLQKVRGLDLVELPEQEECCGFGGTFAVKNADTSAAMLAEKIRSIQKSGADICTAGDNSCLMHIFGGLHKQGSSIRTVHIAEILASTEEGVAA